MYFATLEDHNDLYGSKFVNDLRDKRTGWSPLCIYPKDYNNEPVIRLAPSQHEGGLMTASEQRKVTDNWVEFLKNSKLPLKEVQTVTSLSQKVFDALCFQDSIESLRIKWLNCKDISHITNLKNLKKLFIERGTKTDDITPLAKLDDLEILILGETVKVTDYSPLRSLKKLKVFSVCRYVTNYYLNTPSKLKMTSVDFLYDMPSLEYVDLVDVRNKILLQEEGTFYENN